MALLKGQIFLHNTVHVAIVDIHHYYFLPFLECFVLIL